MSELIPELRARIPVEIRTERLPREELAKPRAIARVRRDGDRLHVAAELVYGDPPVARVEDGRLVALGAGVVPRRNETAEQALGARLERELGLAPGGEVALAPAQAIEFRAALERFSGDVLGTAHREFALAPALEPQFRGGADRLELEFTSGRGGARGSTRRASCARGARASRWCRSRAAASRRCPAPGSRSTASGSPTCSPRAATTASCPASALPDLARLCAELDVPPPPGFARLRALVDDFAGLPRGRAARRPHRRAAPLPGGRRALARVPARGRARGPARRRHGPGQDAAGALRGRRGATLVVAPTSVLFGWAEQAAKLPPVPTHLRVPRPAPGARPARRRHAHQLRAAAPRRGGALGGRLGHGRARRGAGDQERRQPGRARGVRAARPLPAHA